MTSLYDDTYAGPRWRYGYKYRPPGYGHQPDGFILQSDRNREGMPYGTRDWPRQLTADEVRTYELVLVASVGEPP